jgi:hypothetical protein
MESVPAREASPLKPIGPSNRMHDSRQFHRSGLMRWKWRGVGIRGLGLEGDRERPIGECKSGAK